MKINLNSYFLKNLKILDYNAACIGYLGLIAHPLYWVWWTFVDSQPFENIYIRIIGVVSCALFLVRKKWPSKLKRYFSVYWFLGIMYNCPFFFTVYTIDSGFSALWTSVVFCSLYLTIMMMQNYFLFFLNYISGVVLAVLFCYIKNSGLDFPDSDYFLYTYLPVLSFAIATGFIFDYGNKKGVLAQEKAKVYKSLAGSIAHEIRNPLNTINVLSNQINSTLQNLENEMQDCVNEARKQNEIIDNQTNKPKK